MRVLVFNPGSNSLKFQIIEAQAGAWGRKLVHGAVDPIGANAKLTASSEAGHQFENSLPVSNQTEAAEAIFSHSIEGDFAAVDVGDTGSLALIACRVVHGASRFREPARVDAGVLQAIEALDDLAPLHNANSVSILRMCHERYPGLPAMAIFDSAFHATLPEVAYRYALPYELAERHGIRRFGFHGISHRYLMTRYAEIHGLPLDNVNIITLHLEGGSSAAAIKNGKSIDTSMGFTPLEGLMMATRCGDIDPALVGFLARKEGISTEDVEHLLNKKSGLLGISGSSPDTRELVQHPDQRSELALDMFAYRVRKYIGAYLAALNGTDAIVFGGGIGENTPIVRRKICEGLSALGLKLDNSANDATVDREGGITELDSQLHAFVIPTEEGLMMAREAVEAF